MDLVHRQQLLLNVDKRKELIVEYPPLYVSASTVERGDMIKFLGVQISENLTWSQNTTGGSLNGSSRDYMF